MNKDNVTPEAPQQQQEQMFAVVPLELLNAVNEYLSTQPFKDVVGIFNALKQTVRVAKDSSLTDVKFEQAQQ